MNPSKKRRRLQFDAFASPRERFAYQETANSLQMIPGNTAPKEQVKPLIDPDEGPHPFVIEEENLDGVREETGDARETVASQDSADEVSDFDHMSVPNTAFDLPPDLKTRNETGKDEPTFDELVEKWNEEEQEVRQMLRQLRESFVNEIGDNKQLFRKLCTNKF